MYLATTLADAPGLSCDCHYQPRFVDGWQSQEAGRSRAIGLPYRGQSVAFFISSLLAVLMDFGATTYYLCGSNKAHLKAKMR